VRDFGKIAVVHADGRRVAPAVEHHLRIPDEPAIDKHRKTVQLTERWGCTWFAVRKQMGELVLGCQSHFLGSHQTLKAIEIHDAGRREHGEYRPAVGHAHDRLGPMPSRHVRCRRLFLRREGWRMAEGGEGDALLSEERFDGSLNSHVYSP